MHGSEYTVSTDLFHVQFSTFYEWIYITALYFLNFDKKNH